MQSLESEYREQLSVFKKRMGAVAGYSLIASLCMLAVPAFLFQIYDRVLLSRSIETLIAMFFIALVILFAYAVFDMTRHHLLARAAVDFERNLSGPLLAAELSRQSDPQTQAVKDLQGLRQTVASPIFANLFDVPMMPIFTIIIFLVHPVLGGVLLLGAVGLVGIAIWGDRASAPANKDLMKATLSSYNALESQVSMQEMVRAQGSYKESVSQWGRESSKQMNNFLRSTQITTTFSSATKSLRQLLQISMIGIGAALVLADQASVGVIFAASIVGSRALAPVEQIVGGWRNLSQAWNTKARLEERIKELALPTDRTQLPTPKGLLAAEKIAFVPGPKAPALLRNVNVAFQPGESIAVIGPSGAGKSTLAKLLVGYYEPSAGRVSLDGQDLRAWDPTARGLHMGYMPQAINFFQATIRENIARMRLNDDPALAIKAAQRAGVHDLIVQFPMGYDTPMSRKGFWPSGGQAQLIALARAFYGDPKVMVLDEPNSALDQQGEAIFHHAIAQAKKAGMTLIVVTQRPTMLQFVDKILIMQEGQVKDYGDKDEVLKRNFPRQVAGQGGQQVQQPKRPASSQSAASPTAANQSDTTAQKAGQAAPQSAGDAAAAKSDAEDEITIDLTKPAANK